jgi:hypothetical protein
MAGRAEDVQVAVADFQGEEHVDPFQGDRAVDVEEVHGQHGTQQARNLLMDLDGRVGRLFGQSGNACCRCPSR